MVQKCLSIKDTYHHPSIETISLSEDGEAYDLKTGDRLVKKINGYMEYYTVNVPKHGTHSVHRLMAETFHSSKRGPDQNVVNHKDGNKFNCEKSNVEWSTYSENSLHAYMTGLRDDNRVVIALDLSNGNIIEFYSLSACARYFGDNPEKIHRWLNSSYIYPYNRNWNLRYEDGEFKPLTDADIGNLSRNSPRDIYLVDQSGRVVILNSISETSKYLGSYNSKVSEQVNSNDKEWLKGYKVYFKEDLESDLENILDLRFERSKPKPPRRKPKKVRVIDNDSSNSKVWDSVEDFAFSVTASKNTIQKSMSKNNGKWRNFYLEYLD